MIKRLTFCIAGIYVLHVSQAKCNRGTYSTPADQTATCSRGVMANTGWALGMHHSNAESGKLRETDDD